MQSAEEVAPSCGVTKPVGQSRHIENRFIEGVLLLNLVIGHSMQSLPTSSDPAGQKTMKKVVLCKFYIKT